MSDQPLQNDDPRVKELQQKIEALQKKEAAEKLARSQEAKSTGQPEPRQPTEAGEQATLKKLLIGKSSDALTQAQARLAHSAPAYSEQGMDRRVEGGAEVKDKEYWPNKGGVEG